MRYVLLVYSNPRNWGHPTFLRTPEVLEMSGAQRAEMAEGFEGLLHELHESGELISAAALADPSTVRTVRVRGGRPLATDGPFVEVKEQMAGVFVLDCASPERAEEIAARFPDARFGAIELRPVMGVNGQEM
ncbi:YciI family protein [Allorhizocola rhizosphaerae]|uniref:YciI family protein n=1 Tax=Allorhizocola rhizosphaerae TaxID=1872709 RepID=UPI000E3E66FA|nr:YciI family protein [Allorhizocola rhizosphaerae]